MFIENEGALFQGPQPNAPEQIWNGAAWVPYKGSHVKPYEWGYEISEEECNEMIAEDRKEREASRSRNAAPATAPAHKKGEGD